MNSKKWIKIFLIFSVLGVGFAGAVNFVVDPGYIYLKKNFNNNVDEYAKKLFTSEKGLIATGWNERVVKSAMAKYAGNFDCVILGSSHIIQISQVRHTGNIQQVCPKLLNLGVSGASLEDLIVFTDIIFENDSKPKKVFIDIAPWTLKFGMDKRYQINQFHYDNLVNILNDKTKKLNYFDYKASLIKNIFNLEYFINSLKELKTAFKISKIKYPKTDFQYVDGYIEAINLVDGSYLYDSKTIVKYKEEIQNIKAGGGDYKIDGKIYDKDAVELFTSMLDLYQSKEIEVNFILTPYHPNVFKAGLTKPVEHIHEIEKLAHQISNDYKIKIYGSFFPDNLGCKNEEFFDFMHASGDCLNKIKFSSLKFSSEAQKPSVFMK
ncbi:MAG: hypothetical protein A3E21_04835 [Sulfurimonas sp. RIFCSPHIGHO2_12_FULL_36_9]|uniref:hypothetical protein n=1 Tax=Sulfurimonas sp. RIFCSPLOWO2_12_36_12 TaxID=1802253 RepID=UPI0008D4634E|nr:hypothetical protein [Sulfurimonas sp. RIFCSPLOWO2_12_36_12]OHD96939.1 MAG: hypothetical protein A3E21_04835 [Sulfurimonas sp. RIFCSPHIGHO2_12_FULL_36_9]OHD98316.1 MAG: hypothetical protein A3J26_00675 [Sulfurimonas sp. RIFCSPLOWO2_02_FULL_36_28]OHE00160.1 MAG: hypothetical protein A2W82_02830 [Sulfurimonas sp. RIFCSPLOWO2_12_36_12]OHE01816.1 MAG: hypothetical protein A3K14_01750 [Sulfurimonas sp. RIFCSPLOWO2_12_FULL_36_74]